MRPPRATSGVWIPYQGTESRSPERRPRPGTIPGRGASPRRRRVPRSGVRGLGAGRRLEIEAETAVQEAYGAVGVLVAGDEGEVHARGALGDHLDRDPDAAEQREDVAREPDPGRRALADHRDHRETV